MVKEVGSVGIEKEKEGLFDYIKILQSLTSRDIEGPK
jgi:hypothetical protein